MLGPAVAFHGWGEVGEEVLFLIPFLRFFLVLLLVFFSNTGDHASRTTAFSCTEAVT